MSTPHITICGVTDFKALDLEEFTHVISIWMPDEELETYKGQINRGFPYADIHFSVYNDSEKLDAKQSASITDVEKSLAFAKSLTDDATLLIHCMAGISRSTAIAIAVINQALGPGSELQAAKAVKKLRPIADPNLLIIHLADQILKRDNALIEATKQVFLEDKNVPIPNCKLLCL